MYTLYFSVHFLNSGSIIMSVCGHAMKDRKSLLIPPPHAHTQTHMAGFKAYVFVMYKYQK